jgi:hypothetical protein
MGLKINVDASRMATLTAFVGKLQDSEAMRLAMSQGLNEHLAKQKTDTITTVAAQTGLPKGMVEAGASVRRSSAATLTGAVVMKGGAVFAGAKTSRSWSKGDAGAKHGDWPTYTRKGGMMAHTFIAYGRIMRRTGKGRGPIHSVYGPVIPNEMLREDMPNMKRAEESVSMDLAKRVLRAMQARLGY